MTIRPLLLTPVRSFSASMNGNQVRDRLLHHARRLDHLRQEHLAGAEEVADDVHAVHQRPFDHRQRWLAGGGQRARHSSVSATTKSVIPLTRACVRRFLDRQLAPGEVGAAVPGLAFADVWANSTSASPASGGG
jgi:hypothetical protein